MLTILKFSHSNNKICKYIVHEYYSSAPITDIEQLFTHWEMANQFQSR